MKPNRRKFLQQLALGTSAMAVGLPSFATEGTNKEEILSTPEHRSSAPGFNMSGYAAPKIDKVRIGIVGLGMRGPGAVSRMSMIEGVEIKALCDKLPERATKAQKYLTDKGLPKAKEYSGENGWKEMIEKEDLDLIYSCTPWYLHTPIAVYAMEHGKHVATEVPAALTIDECWQLVQTSEKTRKHCMMLENCCYDFFEMLTLNMARQGLFGELVHAEGAYIHNLLDLNFDKNGYYDMWRLKQNIGSSGNLYPTHGLGPIAQCLNINRGDKMDYLVSMSTNDFQMGKEAEERAKKDEFYKQFVGKKYRGNMNTTTIRTAKGKTMMIQHDVTSPRIYSRIHLLSGTKGFASKWPEPERISFGEERVKEADLKELYETHTPPLIKHVGDIAKKVGGHGGMDFIMDWRLIDCLRNGLPLDQDVYDAAAWSCILPLSEKSVAKRSSSVDVPDFTKGSWTSNKPVNLTLDGGGNTTVRSIKS
ncbi:Gfo/Idh/MocA family protein [Pedobacter ginsengisoli]|uniref:Gfo/Idh/MocA family protein n=1 Tax=Pedobacter ginsengisoli TaxID=363852 RepID=UPI00254C9D16|nr:Gfo/Idh/MocA family oxidoreductase [Pedobacter ginsengisoli]